MKYRNYLFLRGQGASRSFAMFIAATIVLLLSTSSFAAPILIDDFSDPTPAHTYSIGVAPIDFTVQDATTGLGGERDVLIDVISSATPLPFSAAGVVGGGYLSMSSDSGSSVITTLQYDGLDPGDDLLNAEGLGGGSGIDLTDAAGSGPLNDSFLLTFESISAGIGAEALMDVVIVLHSVDGDAEFVGVLDEVEDPTTFVVEFGDFDTSGSFSFSDVTSIEFIFNEPGFQGVDFILSDITIGVSDTVVPEPSSYLLAVMGLAMLIGFRSKRKIEKS